MKFNKMKCLYVIWFLAFAIASPLKVGAELNVSMLKNARYSTVDWDTSDRLGKSVKLVNGEYYWQGPNGLMDNESVSIGKIALGDLNGDGKKDAAVILLHNAGGSGTVIQVAAVLDVNGKPRHIASRNLGDRTEIRELKIRKGLIMIKLANSRFFPGQKKTVQYKLEGNKMIGSDPFTN